jgi:hypothetical protein
MMIDFERLAEESRTIAFEYGNQTITGVVLDYIDAYDDIEGDESLILKLKFEQYSERGYSIAQMKNIKIIN